MGTPLTLPTIEAIEEADRKLSSALSDLDGFSMEVKLIDGPEISVEEAARMFRDDVPFPKPPPFDFDADSFARLLVFADDALDDADTLRREAENLRQQLLWLYCSRVLDARVAARAQGAGDDA